MSSYTAVHADDGPTRYDCYCPVCRSIQPYRHVEAYAFQLMCQTHAPRDWERNPHLYGADGLDGYPVSYEPYSPGPDARQRARYRHHRRDREDGRARAPDPDHDAPPYEPYSWA